MATLAERALLAAVRHVAESGATWPSVELRQSWNRMTMTNSRLACRTSSDRIFDWYLRLAWGLEPVVDASAGDSEEGLYDSEGHDSESSSDSSSPTWYEYETHRACFPRPGRRWRGRRWGWGAFYIESPRGLAERGIGRYVIGTGPQ